MIYQVNNDGQTSSSCSQCKKQLMGKHPSGQDQEHRVHNIRLIHKSHKLNHDQPDKEQLVDILEQENRRLKDLTKRQQNDIIDLRFELEKYRKNNAYGLSPKVQVDYYSTARNDTYSSPRALGRYLSPEIRERGYLEQEFMLQKTMLQKEVKQLQLQLMQVTNKLKQHQQTVGWMHKFILSFDNMTEQLSLQYGSKMDVRGLSLRKRTSICWKYIKQLINYLAK